VPHTVAASSDPIGNTVCTVANSCRLEHKHGASPAQGIDGITSHHHNKSSRTSVDNLQKPQPQISLDWDKSATQENQLGNSSWHHGPRGDQWVTVAGPTQKMSSGCLPGPADTQHKPQAQKVSSLHPGLNYNNTVNMQYMVPYYDVELSLGLQAILHRPLASNMLQR
jgi:hypothetical protein